jgi:prepilin-type N-terminal cleavage/methylation domain-containing protein
MRRDGVIDVAVLRRRPKRGDDAGMTLVELLVSMAIMSIVMTIFTTGMVLMYRSANDAEARADAQAQVSLALQRLEKEVRSAAGIGMPYIYGGVDPRVEFVTVGTAEAECVQLRVSGGRLQLRRWMYQSSPAQPTPWTTLASGVTSPQPFSRRLANDAVGYQRLRIQLRVVSGGGPTRVTKDSDLELPALNSTRETGPDTCAEGRTFP